MTERIRVAVVDDHPIFREGVAFTIRSSQAFEIVAEGASADDAIRIAKDLLPDVILLDVSMPGGGIEAARVISTACPVVKVIMLTVSEQEEDVTQALEAGANGYILKGTSGTDLISTLQSVSRGESYVSPGLAARLLAVSMRNVRQQTRPAEQVDLTKREEQILELVARGPDQQGDREYADDLRKDRETLHDQRHAEAAGPQPGRSRSRPSEKVQQRLIRGLSTAALSRGTAPPPARTGPPSPRAQPRTMKGRVRELVSSIIASRTKRACPARASATTRKLRRIEVARSS